MIDEVIADEIELPSIEFLNEPDHLEWIDDETGLHCEIKRNDKLGTLCGYVKVQLKQDANIDEIKQSLDVHGGITYDNNEPDGYIFGFDCAHLGDLIPVVEMKKIMLGIDSYGTYRNIEYVKHECKELAKQLKEVEG